MPAFASLAELATKLRALPEVSPCLATKVFIYASGRDPALADSCAVQGASRAFNDGGQSFPALLKGLVTAPTFRLRRAAEVTP
jgi:hypothetical protein